MRNATFGHHASKGACRHGFTLIEVLVVVAIIALLVSILLPSLKAARDQARLVLDQAHLKQIATSMTTYQNEFASYVPVVFNDATVNHAGIKPPARILWVSVALYRYAAETRNLGERTFNGVTYDFSPDAVWTPQMRDIYETHFMPEIYACPFQDGKGPRDFEATRPAGSQIVTYTKSGRFDRIQTWLTENIIAGQRPSHGEAWPEPIGPEENLAKHTAFSWNCIKNPGDTFRDGTPIPSVNNAQPYNSEAAKNTYRKWTQSDLRRLRAGSFGSVTVAYCAQGENILGDQGTNLVGLANPGSHRQGGKGGTNAIFADTHVEWVPGKQIGWP